MLFVKNIKTYGKENRWFIYDKDLNTGLLILERLYKEIFLP